MPHCPSCGQDLSGWPVTDTENEAREQSQTELSNELSQRMTFGKYKNWSVDHVLRVNPGYIVWAAENVDHFNVSEELLKEARNKASLNRVQPPELDRDNRLRSSVSYFGDTTDDLYDEWGGLSYEDFGNN